MKKTAGECAVLWVGIALVIAWTFVPILVMIWASLMPFNALVNGGLLQWPSGMSFANYGAILGIVTINEVFGGQPADELYIGNTDGELTEVRAVFPIASDDEVCRIEGTEQREDVIQSLDHFEAPGEKEIWTLVR